MGGRAVIVNPAMGAAFKGPGTSLPAALRIAGMAAALEFAGVSKEYQSLTGAKRVTALEAFDLRVEEGEIFGFLGPNGAGKSTAMHLAMGFTLPTRGSGRMLGRPFGHVRTRRRVGFLSENVALYHRRAESLVRFYGGLNGMGGERLSRRAAEVLELVGLQDDGKRNAGKFSRGMLQRVGLAQALVNDPELLILDEPTSALDPKARVAVRELLLHARQEGRTVFLSSHLLSEVELVCDRVAILHRGKLMKLAKTSELLQRANKTEIVARRVPASEFEGAVAQDGVVRFRVSDDRQRAAVERVWALGGELISANPASRSLEEIFLEITGEKNAVAAKGQA
jgi:ABC-2 type transport system ATP-binding protein